MKILFTQDLKAKNISLFFLYFVADKHQNYFP
ncbi:hypothetical protein POKO110462_11390 [Pontibacter korlensis]